MSAKVLFVDDDEANLVVCEAASHWLTRHAARM